MINTLNHLCYLLYSSPAELEEVITHIDKYYYQKTEVKTNKDGSPKLDARGQPKIRILYPSTGKLKSLQEKLLSRILYQLEMPVYAYGAIKGRDNVMNAKQHQGKKYIFTTDLKDFFPYINHHQVFEMFRRKNFSPTVARLLTQLTTYKGQVPQGAPTSPMIANLVFSKTGDKLSALAAQHNLTFTSFIDDLTFSGARDFKPLVQEIMPLIKADGFRISHKKTNYKTKNPKVTGAIVKNNHLAFTSEFKEKLKFPLALTAEQQEGVRLYAKKLAQANNNWKNFSTTLCEVFGKSKTPD